jgi:hypothetical protein
MTGLVRREVGKECDTRRQEHCSSGPSLRVIGCAEMARGAVFLRVGGLGLRALINVAATLTNMPGCTLSFRVGPAQVVVRALSQQCGQGVNRNQPDLRSYPVHERPSSRGASRARMVLECE